jgi:prevent-host-death family protein
VGRRKAFIRTAPSPTVDLVQYLVDTACMEQVGVHEAKTHFSRLLKRVAAGEQIVVTSSGRAVAKIVPVQDREFGMDRDRFRVPDDFDAPDPAFEALFESGAFDG